MEDQETAEGAGATGEGSPGDRRKVSDGIREGLGVLSALKDAFEETIVEARRGDLSPERGKQALSLAMSRAQEVVAEARERLDGVPQREFDLLKERVDGLEVRLKNLEHRAGEDPGAEPAHSGP